MIRLMQLQHLATQLETIQEMIDNLSLTTEYITFHEINNLRNYIGTRKVRVLEEIERILKKDND